MGIALDTNSCFVTNPGAVVTGYTPTPGDTLQVRSFSSGGSAQLLDILALGVSARILRVKSPLMHDEVKGYHIRALAGGNDDLFPDYVTQPLKSQDVLLVEGTGEAAATDVAALQVLYQNNDWAAGRYATLGDIQSRIKNIVTVEAALVTPAVIGAWGSIGLTSTENLLHVGSDYALLGYEVDVALCAVGVQGIDTGNFRACGPGSTDRYKTRDYFARLSAVTSLPVIPIIAAGNAPGINVVGTANTAAVTSNVDLIFAELN